MASTSSGDGLTFSVCGSCFQELSQCECEGRPAAASTIADYITVVESPPTAETTPAPSFTVGDQVQIREGLTTSDWNDVDMERDRIPAGAKGTIQGHDDAYGPGFVVAFEDWGTWILKQSMIELQLGGAAEHVPYACHKCGSTLDWQVQQDYREYGTTNMSLNPEAKESYNVLAEDDSEIHDREIDDVRFVCGNCDHEPMWGDSNCPEYSELSDLYDRSY